MVRRAAAILVLAAMTIAASFALSFSSASRQRLVVAAFSSPTASAFAPAIGEGGRSRSRRRLVLLPVRRTRPFFGTSRVFSVSSDASDSRSPSSPSSSSEDEGDDSTPTKKRVVFLGTPDVAATALRTLHSDSQNEDSPYELVGVVTQPPRRRKKRSSKVVPSPVGLVAEELGIRVLCPEKARDKEFLDELETEVKPDLCITAAYGQYLPKRFLATPTYGTVNIHPSLLPRWRGASPVQRSLEAGDNPVGVSVLFTVSKMDAGPIISQQSYTIENVDEEDASTLLPKLFEVGTDLLLECMPDVLEGKITMDTASSQNEEDVVEASMIDSAEGELKVWKTGAEECANKIRGFSMWPGTYMYFRIGEDDEDFSLKEPLRVKVIKARALKDEEGKAERAEPTDAVALGPKKKDGLRVVCHDGSVLELLQVQPATKKAMDAKSFVNGMRGATIRWAKMPEEEEEEEQS